MIHPEHDPNDRVWHIGDKDVYSSPRVHKNGRRRPKTVTFESKHAALRALLKNIQKYIDECTLMMKKTRNRERAETYRKIRKEYRRKEKEIKKTLNKLADRES